jgi:hypothetical protein
MEHLTGVFGQQGAPKGMEIGYCKTKKSIAAPFENRYYAHFVLHSEEYLI